MNDFIFKDDNDKLKILMSEPFIKKTAIFIKDMLGVRRETLYTHV